MKYLLLLLISLNTWAQFTPFAPNQSADPAQSAKGSLHTADGTTDAIQSVGVNGTILQANSAQANGLEWIATLGLANGGTNKNLTAVNGGVLYTDADSAEVSAAGTAGQALVSGGAGAPTWFNPTANRVIIAGASGELSQDAGLTYDPVGNLLTVSTAISVNSVYTSAINSPAGTNADIVLNPDGIGEVRLFDKTGPGVLSMDANEYIQSFSNSFGLASLITDEVGSGALVFATNAALAGNPTAPTAAFGDNDTSIATTAYVQTELASAGIDTVYARATYPTDATPLTIASETTVVFDNEITDSDAAYNPTTGQFTVPTTGWYNYFAKITTNNAASVGEQLTIRIKADGTTFDLTTYEYEVTGTFVAMPAVAGGVYLTAGQVVTVTAHGTAGDELLPNIGNVFSISKE